jgi:hypothetical protein
MKIIEIKNENLVRDDEKNSTDLLDVLVEYNNGVTSICSMYRARYDRLVCQGKIMKKYNIPQCDMKLLEDLFRDEFSVDHVWNTE